MSVQLLKKYLEQFSKNISKARDGLNINLH